MKIKASAKTVLLIDDDSEEHKLFCDKLYEYNSNISCLTAFNCPQGYSLAQNSKPDFIFLDMNLPGTNGIACLRKFKKTTSLKDVPVFIYSGGYVTENEIRLALESGAEKWIRKPNSFDGYIRMFSQCLS
jgi:CheY-like chemotaxis protein